MRFVTDKIHGVIDYVAAIALIAMPFAANFEAISPVAHWLSIAAGLALMLYSLVTSYTYSATGLISFGLHLTLDFAAGVVFLIAPFAFGFGGVPRAFFVAAGAAVVVLVIVTDPKVVSGTKENVETFADAAADAPVTEDEITDPETEASAVEDSIRTIEEGESDTKHSIAGA